MVLDASKKGIGFHNWLSKVLCDGTESCFASNEPCSYPLLRLCIKLSRFLQPASGVALEPEVKPRYGLCVHGYSSYGLLLVLYLFVQHKEISAVSSTLIPVQLLFLHSSFFPFTKWEVAEGEEGVGGRHYYLQREPIPPFLHGRVHREPHSDATRKRVLSLEPHPYPTRYLLKKTSASLTYPFCYSSDDWMKRQSHRHIVAVCA